MSERCKAKVFEDRGGYHGCVRNATLDGYCGTHHPNAIAARRAKSDARYTAQKMAWDARRAAERESGRRAECFPVLLDALETMVELLKRRANGSVYQMTVAEKDGLSNARAAIKQARGEATESANGRG